jgi:hypothetical protein
VEKEEAVYGEVNLTQIKNIFLRKWHDWSETRPVKEYLHENQLRKAKKYLTHPETMPPL